MASASVQLNFIQFDPLSLDVQVDVVSKFLFELEGKLAEKNVSISIDEDARLWLAEKGFDPKMGARPMSRLIQEKIKKPLAEKLLFGELSNGGHVRISIADGELCLETEVEEPA